MKYTHHTTKHELNNSVLVTMTLTLTTTHK